MRISYQRTGDVQVRTAGVGDRAAIERLYRDLVPGSDFIRVQGDRIADLDEDPSTLLLVAERDGVVLGSALLFLCKDVMFGDQPFGVVENVVVDPSTRGMGVGRALIRVIEDVAVRQDCSKLMLSSTIVRHDAHRFFEQCGFDGGLKRGFVKYRRQMTPILA